MRRKWVAIAPLLVASLMLVALPANGASVSPQRTTTAVKATASTVTMPSWVPSVCRNYNGKHGKVICVGIKSWQLVALQNHKPIMKMAARHGAEGIHRASDGTGPWPTRRGIYRIFAKYVSKVSTLYHVKMPYFMPFSGGQGIHYSSEYAAGYRYSHGCVGLKSLAQAAALYKWAEVGTTVIVVNA